tara:strand:- start:405 stop:980 length:576 start_codon:yes stop_codon:yes gene_type:complete
MSPRNPAQNEAQRAQTRQQILMAGLKAFAEKGYTAASMAYIAKEAGVSKGLSYHYFSSKEDLLHGIFEMLVAVGEGMEDQITGKSPKEQLRLTVEMGFQFMDEQRDIVRFMTAIAIQPEVTARLKELITKHKNLSIDMYRDIFKALSYDAPLAEAYAFGALMDGTVLGYLALGPDYPLEDMKQKILTKYHL